MWSNSRPLEERPKFFAFKAKNLEVDLLYETKKFDFRENQSSWFSRGQAFEKILRKLVLWAFSGRSWKFEEFSKSNFRFRQNSSTNLRFKKGESQTSRGFSKFFWKIKIFKNQEPQSGIFGPFPFLFYIYIILCSQHTTNYKADCAQIRNGSALKWCTNLGAWGLWFRARKKSSV